MGIYSDSAYKEHVSKSLDKMIAEQIKECKFLLLKLKGKGSLALQEVESSVLKVSKEEFYGKYLKNRNSGDNVQKKGQGSKKVPQKVEEKWDEEVVIEKTKRKRNRARNSKK